MKKSVLLFCGLLSIICTPLLAFSQETDPDLMAEESAEVSLEEYSDDFQENFFEALKQKGIENYDRAINLLLECKRLDADNRVIDHELAKVYLEDKQYPLAEDHAIIAVNAAPENLWYLNTLVTVIGRQNSSFNRVKELIPFENAKLKENLALVYYQRSNYTAAKDILRETNKSQFTEDLSDKIEKRIAQRSATTTSLSFSAKASNSNEGENTLRSYKNRIKSLIETNSAATNVLLQVSEEALEAYPSQPYFYFANGYALNRSGKHRAAIDILEAALDYMLDDISLSNKIYQELSDAYKATHNTVKSNMYLQKIKAGF